MSEPEFYFAPPWDTMPRMKWWPNHYGGEEMHELIEKMEEQGSPTVLGDKDSGHVKLVAVPPDCYRKLLAKALACDELLALCKAALDQWPESISFELRDRMEAAAVKAEERGVSPSPPGG